MQLLIRLVSVWLMFMNQFIESISIRLVIGIVGIVVRVVVRIIRVELGMLWVFLEVISEISRMVIRLVIVSGVLVMWVMNIIVRVRQIENLLRLNEQLVGIIRFIVELWMFMCLSLCIICGSIVLEEVVFIMISSFLWKQCRNGSMCILERCRMLLSIVMMKIRQVVQNISISVFRWLSELMLQWVVVKVIVLNMLSGVRCMIMFMMWNMMWLNLLIRWVMLLVCLLIRFRVLLNSMENSRIWRMLFLVKVLNIEVGIRFMRNVMGLWIFWVCLVYRVMLLVGSLLRWMLVLLFRFRLQVIIRLRIRVMVVRILKQIIDFRLMWLIFFRLLVLEMLLIIMQKMISVMSILISLMKLLFSGFICMVRLGMLILQIMFIIRLIMICRNIEWEQCLMNIVGVFIWCFYWVLWRWVMNVFLLWYYWFDQFSLYVKKLV